MIDSKYGHLLADKLSELTNERSITWMTLPRYFEYNDNEPLRRKIIENNKYAYSLNEKSTLFLINEYKSYCTAIKGGVVCVFYKQHNQSVMFEIAVQVAPTQNLQYVDNDEELQRKATKLWKQILTEFNDGEKFISDILKL